MSRRLAALIGAACLLLLALGSTVATAMAVVATTRPTIPATTRAASPCSPI